MTEKHPSIRTLPDPPDLDQLKRQAKELLKAFADGDADALAQVQRPLPRRDARDVRAASTLSSCWRESYGFRSWPKLKAYVDGVTVHRLADAVRAAISRHVRSMLEARPELVNLCMAENDEHRALHYAVLERYAGDGAPAHAARRRSARRASGPIAWRRAPSRWPPSAATPRSSRSFEPRNSGGARAIRRHGSATRPPTSPPRSSEATRRAMIATLEAHPALDPGVERREAGRPSIGPRTALAAAGRLAVGTRRGRKGPRACRRDRAGCRRTGARRRIRSAPRLATKLAEMLLGRGSRSDGSLGRRHSATRTGCARVTREGALSNRSGVCCIMRSDRIARKCFACCWTSGSTRTNPARSRGSTRSCSRGASRCANAPRPAGWRWREMPAGARRQSQHQRVRGQLRVVGGARQA